MQENVVVVLWRLVYIVISNVMKPISTLGSSISCGEVVLVLSSNCDARIVDDRGVSVRSDHGRFPCVDSGRQSVVVWRECDVRDLTRHTGIDNLDGEAVRVNVVVQS
jgi:hypothetical protein